MILRGLILNQAKWMKSIQVEGRKYFENKHKPKIIEQPISKFLDLSLNTAMHV